MCIPCGLIIFNALTADVQIPGMLTIKAELVKHCILAAHQH